MATKKKAKKKDDSHLGLFVAGVAAAAGAGAYYLYGPESKRHRKQLRGWALKASGEVLEQVEKLKTIDKKKYNALVQKATAKYKKVRDINNKDIDKLKKELQAQWSVIESEAKKGAAKGKREVAKAERKTRKAVHRGAVAVAKKTAPPKRKKTAKRKRTARRKTTKK